MTDQDLGRHTVSLGHTDGMLHALNIPIVLYNAAENQIKAKRRHMRSQKEVQYGSIEMVKFDKLTTH